jgi:type II secretory ATPase GspE/PulE/Tfp pilus assembly ATPase PilB-like protein
MTRKLHQPSDLPVGAKVLTGDAGPIVCPVEKRRDVVVLDLGSEGLLVIHTPTEEGQNLGNVMRIRAIMLRENAKVDVATADPIIIEVAYSRTSKQRSTPKDGEDAKRRAQIVELLQAAVDENASDVHFYSYEDHAEILFRVDGDLQLHRHLTIGDAELLQNAMFELCEERSKTGVAAFERTAFLDLSLSLDLKDAEGRMRRTTFRWASGPAHPEGADIILRVLPTGRKASTIESLGYTELQVEMMDHMVRQSEGMVLLAGPTGSGKSTTLAALEERWFHRYKGRRSMRTIEDPVEITLAGGKIRQVPVGASRNRADGGESRGFFLGLRAAMRQDPDALGVGEIRDPDTAKIAQRAGQSGHKLFSTVHVNSAIEVAGRLMELGMDASVLCGEGFINGVVFQRLIRKVCSHCALGWKDVSLTLRRDNPEFVAELTGQFMDVLLQLRFHGPGCEVCKGRPGRMAVAEMLIPDLMLLDYLAHKEINLARAYWLLGRCRRFGHEQSRTWKEAVVDRMKAGLVSPLDAWDLISGFDTLPDREEQARLLEERDRAAVVRPRAVR